MGRGLILLLLCSALSGTTAEQEPLVVFRQGNYGWAFRLFLERARLCDHEAQNFVGIMYHLGLATTRDTAAAAYWYRQAANAGSGDAPRNFATLLSEGHGIAQSYLQAYSWLYIASQRGNLYAERALDAMSDKLTANQIMRAKSWATGYAAATHRQPTEAVGQAFRSCSAQ